ncbi:MAG: YihY/virulence factor BrkB family protein [Acidobacteriota bacterium]|nr:YihY/virulence factor BrkB family protein [Acidobacteriota bacterium]
MATESIWKLGGLSWKDLAKRVWAEIQDDDVFGRAAQLAYYFLLALFPLLLFLVSLLGYFAGENSELRADLFRYLGAVLPGEASDLVSKTIGDVTQGSGGGKLSFGILAALWAASNGMGAVSESLNVAYDVKESRPWWKSRLVAVGLTVALAVLIISALILVLYGHTIAEAVAGSFGLGEAFEVTWKIVQWPVVLAFVILGFGLIYYFAPNLHDAEWKWITPGAGIAVLLWLLVSFGFRTYLHFFNSYSATYGSLGAVIILMLWFYLTGAAILIGGEINSEIEHAMAEAGEPDAKERGEKSPGQKERADAKSVQTGKAVKPATVTASTTAAAHPKSQSVAKSSRATSSRLSSAASREERAFTLKKVAVVAGVWVVSKFWPGKSDRHPK